MNNFEVIFEFGGGYGNLAYTFKKINKHCKFIIFDTKELESPKVVEKPSPSEGNRKLRRMQAKANRKKRK